MEETNQTTMEKTIKFRAVLEKLDYQGNVVEDVKTVEYKINNYNSKYFIDSLLKYGDYRDVPMPINVRYVTDFFSEVFGTPHNSYRASWDDIRKYKLVESEEFDGVKFVLYKRGEDHVMKWVPVEKGEVNE